MYPFFRLGLELWKARRAPAMGLLDTHVSWHRCWPWDLDLWMELNNGRTLTLFDLGRVPMGRRSGLHKALAARGWGAAVAGAVVRYRRRVRAFDAIEMRSRCIGWDGRFFYIEQAMWVRGECANHIVLRSAVTSKDGIVAPVRVLEAMGQAQGAPPPLPDWVQAWIGAEDARPWPPAP